MRRHLKARYLAPALVALVMIIYGAFTSVWNTRAILTEARSVDHTRRVMIELENCLIAMLNLETGHRGYVLTNQVSFLEPYEKALGQMDEQIDLLDELTRDTPIQQARVAEIRQKAEVKKAELARGVGWMRSGNHAAAVASVRAGDGKRMMDDFRAIIEAMRADEAAQLAARQNQMVLQFKDTNAVVVTTAVVALAAGITGLALLTLYLKSKDREAALEIEKQKAQQADKAKTDFLAMMSHEIRTPMNAILGFGELLHESVEKPQNKHFAHAIVSSGRSLLTLINDILDLSKIEASKMELNPETVEMKRFTENLETLFSYRAQEKGLDYSIRLDPSVPAFLSFDALRLRQVLVNLIGNAVKFTREGRVAASLLVEEKGDGLLLVAEVEDSGIGIPEDKLVEIFRPFYQVESQRGRHYQGTGLGLSICDRLVSLMGGAIHAESTLGKGSVFRVSVPVSRSRDRSPSYSHEFEPVAGQIDFNRLTPGRILVVDDVPLNRELIREFLAGSHHEVIEAENGEQAVMISLRSGPDVVLMDLRMPGIDGREALSMLKARAETRNIPLVAISASSLLDDQEELKRLFDGYASKPISRDRLYLELARFLPPLRGAATVGATAVVPAAVEAPDRSWPELRGALANLRDSKLPALIKLVPAQATAAFAGEVAALAERHDCPPLADYALRLSTAAGTMNVGEAARLLAAFPGVIDLVASDV